MKNVIGEYRDNDGRSGTPVRERGRAECRDGHEYRALDAGSVVRCGYLSFMGLGRGELFEQRRLDFLVVWSGKPPRWFADDVKLEAYASEKK